MRIFLAAFLASSLAASLATAADDLEKLRDKQDRAALDVAASSLHAAAAKTPNEANGWYRAAIAYSYVAEVAMELKDKNGAQKAAEAGAADADKAIALNANNADYYRVLGTLSGQVIPANPIAGILSYGKRAKDALDKAIAMDPKSAKAWVAHGVGYYYLPTNFGGGPQNAIKDFRQAIALDSKSAEAYLWLGIALKKEHQNAQAREALGKSLQLDPDRIWAKDELQKTPLQ
ncbi:MAG TPA: tetratricopeptide repeat protein [Bryobacteraceae bacterium]|jgi:tetratricopeptide (TPR) repeat protein|nr:tetratricopeptide repeat protein [Bryobacteraceae bacterium]